MNLFTRLRARRSVPASIAVSDPEFGAALTLRTAHKEIDDIVAELARAGALDEGNGRALDALIGTWQVQHHSLLNAFHADAAGERERRIQSLNAEIDVAEERLHNSQARLKALNTAPSTQGPLDEELGELQAEAGEQMAAELPEEDE